MGLIGLNLAPAAKLFDAAPITALITLATIIVVCAASALRGILGG